MVRTRTFDPSAALSTAVDLFASRGYSDTSMDDIVKATGVSRYGLYGTFGNKRELFEQALERYAEGMGKALYMRLLEPDASLAHIRRIFDERIGDMCSTEERKGCLFVHTAMQLAPENAELQGVLRKFMKRMSKAFEIGLESAQARGAQGHRREYVVVTDGLSIFFEFIRMDVLIIGEAAQHGYFFDRSRTNVLIMTGVETMMKHSKAIVSLALVGLFVLAAPAKADSVEDSGVSSEVNSCVTEVRERLDYTDAARVRHDVLAIERRTVGYTLKIRTMLYDDAATENAIRAYAATCIVNGDNPPLSFEIREGL